ncbi:aldo/keto reductase [Streptomyces iconiensis]|uniref:Aldo/keto reductase n=1 Tax=Streptomyces iconiensis TaxID=1384038 RepID=A0ABT7A305_9ACTN|nr:aldo/keto reductase [Streptomyces iconiensis]MDJ1134998.1 aldo/keto reductase [Streptomyces iconiensis]
MKYHIMGKTGLRISEACLGTGTFGMPGWGASIEESRRLVDIYAEAGGNFLDTANVYGGGASEEYLGELLKGRRDTFVLSTKFNAMTRPGDPNSAGNHRKNLRNSLETSLRKLRTDHVDMLWLHARDGFTPVEEVMSALDDQVRAGKVLYAGASNWPAWEVSRANTLAELRGRSAFAAVQIRYNLLERTPERELFPMARACDISTLAWGPLAEGRLTGKYLRGEKGRLDKEDWAGSSATDEEIIKTVVDCAQETGHTPAQIALAWLRTRPGAVLPILGASREQQLRDCLASLDIELAAEHRERLDEVSRIELGAPHDQLRLPKFTTSGYGDRWRDLVDVRGRKVDDVR